LGGLGGGAAGSQLGGGGCSRGLELGRVDCCLPPEATGEGKGGERGENGWRLEL
jgi:hypothetical protein